VAATTIGCVQPAPGAARSLQMIGSRKITRQGCCGSSRLGDFHIFFSLKFFDPGFRPA